MKSKIVKKKIFTLPDPLTWKGFCEMVYESGYEKAKWKTLSLYDLYMKWGKEKGLTSKKSTCRKCPKNIKSQCPWWNRWNL